MNFLHVLASTLSMFRHRNAARFALGGAAAFLISITPLSAAVIYSENFDGSAFGGISSNGTYSITAPLSNSSMSGYIPSAGSWLILV